MGCLVSTPSDSEGDRRRPSNVGEIVVFVPGLRVPKSSKFSPLSERLSSDLIQRLSALQSRIVLLADQEIQTASKSKKKTATRHGGSTQADLLQSLQDYLPMLLGLVNDGNHLEHLVEFVWVNQEDDTEKTAISSAWYEVLSVLHFMAMLSLSQANALLLPKTTSDGYQPKISEESKRISVDIFLKAAGYLDCACQNVIPRLPPDVRKKLPVDLTEEVLNALCLQALGQGACIQLGMAIDSAKATLAVKRRLACEMVKYWQQAQENVVNVSLASYWGDKHRLFIEWKYAEAKAAAYYFHGLILEETNTDKSRAIAVAALQAAEGFLNESKKAAEQFAMAPPHSRNPPLWGATKYLYERIPKEASCKARTNNELHSSHENFAEKAPPLPDFPVALKPDDFSLPPPDASWNVNGNMRKEQIENQVRGTPTVRKKVP
ncbi:unnamed protein product [Victoria cruziana]